MSKEFTIEQGIAFMEVMFFDTKDTRYGAISKWLVELYLEKRKQDKEHKYE